MIGEISMHFVLSWVLKDSNCIKKWNGFLVSKETGAVSVGEKKKNKGFYQTSW